MLLLSLKDGGKLYYDEVESDFVKEIALTIDEQEDDVSVTLTYLFKQGLLEVIVDNQEYFLTEIPLLIGSETASTRRSRKSRQQKTEQKALQCSTNATKRNGEIDIEIEKEIDIELEKEREGEIEKRGQEKDKTTPPLYGEFKNVKLTDEEYRKLQEELKDHTETMIEKLSRYMASSGKEYKSHYLTILNWYEQDKEKLTQGKKKNEIPNYDDSISI